MGLGVREPGEGGEGRVNVVKNWTDEFAKWLKGDLEIEVYEMSDEKDNWGRADRLNEWVREGVEEPQVRTQQSDEQDQDAEKSTRKLLLIQVPTWSCAMRATF